MSADKAKTVPSPYDYNRLSISDRPHRECFFCGRRPTHSVHAGSTRSIRLYLCDEHLGNLLEILAEHRGCPETTRAAPIDEEVEE